MTTKPSLVAPQPRPLTVGVGVYVPHDFDGPECAAIPVTSDVLAEIERLRALAVANDLHYATALQPGVVLWGEQNAVRNSYWNVRDDELFVSADGFFIAATPKHCDYTVETRFIDHRELASLVAAHPDGGEVVVGDVEREALVRSGLFAPEGVILARFQPQAWINDYAVDVDGACDVDVTEQVLALDLKAILALRDNRDGTDELVDLAALDHHGPFYVEVEDSLCAFFGVDEQTEISQDMLDVARAKLGIAVPEALAA